MTLNTTYVRGKKGVVISERPWSLAGLFAWSTCKCVPSFKSLWFLVVEKSQIGFSIGLPFEFSSNLLKNLKSLSFQPAFSELVCIACWWLAPTRVQKVCPKVVFANILSNIHVFFLFVCNGLFLVVETISSNAKYLSSLNYIVSNERKTVELKSDMFSSKI